MTFPAGTDILFLFTAIAVLLVAGALFLLLLHLVQILRDVRRISKEARDEAGRIIHDIGVIRKILERGGAGIEEALTKVAEKVTGKKK